MRIIFIDNSTDLTSTSLNLKALDSIQKILINFSKELSNKNIEGVIVGKSIYDSLIDITELSKII